MGESAARRHAVRTRGGRNFAPTSTVLSGEAGEKAAMESASDAGRIAGFDGLRAGAMLAVFAGHAAIRSAHNAGLMGVIGFMALSGYLITFLLHRYRVKAEAGTGTPAGWLKTFLSRRALRILPAYALVLVTVGTVATAVTVPYAEGLPYYALFLSNLWIGFSLHDWPGAFSHLWSLSVQEQFYLAWGPLLLFTPARRHATVCAAVLGLSVAGAAALVLAHARAIVFYTSPVTNFGVMAAGGLAALKGGDLVVRPAVGWACAVVGAGAAAYALAPFAGLPIELPMWVCYLLAVPPAAALVGALHRGRLPALAALLQAPAARWLGVRSYGFYLWHLFVTSGCYPVMARLWPGAVGPFQRLPWVAHQLAYAAVCFVVTLGMAAASWRWLEQPLLTLRDRRRAAA
jgi:peptidoglycan/LPS O-acetylase OafA/YrhL